MKKHLIATGRQLLGPSREYESRIERHPSPMKILLVPIVTVMLGSMITALPFFPGVALLPPMGYMMMLAWRLMRPGIWPVWIGLPLGLFDDLWSGQPFGSAALIWSLTMLAIELVDARAVWRDHLQDWFLAAIALTFALFAGLGINGLVYRAPEANVIVPQILLSILLFPLVIRLCARFDRWRLAT